MKAISENLKKVSIVVVLQHKIRDIIITMNSRIGFILNYFFLKFLSATLLESNKTPFAKHPLGHSFIESLVILMSSLSPSKLPVQCHST